MTPPPTLLLFTGPPGTGKSTLASAAADELAAPVLGWDWAMAAMTGFAPIQAALGTLSPTEHRGVGWSILWNLATAQLRRGSSVVLDGVARSVEVEGTRRVARAERARCLVVTTTCTDAGVHRQRVEGTRSSHPRLARARLGPRRRRRGAAGSRRTMRTSGPTRRTRCRRTSVC